MCSRGSKPDMHAQGGIALFVSLLLLLLVGISAFVSINLGNAAEAARQRTTDAALAEAKAALLGYVIGRPIDASEPDRRLGEFPCPDLEGEGYAYHLGCADAASRLGRLPWKTLGLPDLRDGDGERLWYAVADRYRVSPRPTCNNPEDAGCLNSDTPGSISLRDANDALVHDAGAVATYGGAVALIIAPGAALRREDGVTQTRSTTAATLAPVNYLDVAFSEDNANFGDYDANNGFIAGPIRNAAGDSIVNDRIAVITHAEVMPLIEKRVAQEVSICLDLYAQASPNRYPWAADVVQSAISRNYADQANALTGRVPDTLGSSNASSGGAMSASWPGPPCQLGTTHEWWRQWKLRVFYTVADWYKPGAATPTVPCEACLTVTRQSGSVVDIRYFVAVAGRTLPGQSRPNALSSEISNPANFLETENAAAFIPPYPSTLRSGPLNASFNDIALYK
jgi:hypothetical protein